MTSRTTIECSTRHYKSNIGYCCLYLMSVDSLYGHTGPAPAPTPAPAPAPAPAPVPAPAPAPAPARSAASILLKYQELLLSRLINAICRASCRSSCRASWVTATMLYNYRLFVWARDIIFVI